MYISVESEFISILLYIEQPVIEFSGENRFSTVLIIRVYLGHTQDLKLTIYIYIFMVSIIAAMNETETKT